jgi:hypothetical protein
MIKVSSTTAAAFVSPDWASERIRAARTVSGIDAAVFQFRDEIDFGSEGPSITSGTATLAADFVHVTAGDAQILNDFTLGRTLTWRPAENIVVNQSYYYQSAFRQMELANRLVLNKVVERITEKAGRDDPYWAEQELAVQSAQAAPLAASKDAEGDDWHLGGKRVARASSRGYAFSLAERKAFARFFSRHFSLHPQIRTALLASGQLPERLELVRRQRVAGDRRPGIGESTQTLSFSDIHRTKVNYPLPPGLIASVAVEAQGSTIESKGLSAALAAIAGSAKPAKPSFDAIVDRVKSACLANRPLEAILGFFMLAQQYSAAAVQPGGQLAAPLRELMPYLRPQLQSPDAAKLTRASDLAGAGKKGTSVERESAALYLANANDLDSLPYGTIRYLTFANLVRGSGDVGKWDKTIWKKMPSLADCYWLHIAAYPWASNAFSDLGHFLYASFNTWKAWEVWDLGRAIDPDWKTGVMISVLRLEEHLRTAMHDNF